MVGTAPIVLFVHDRPAQTRLALDALADNPLAAQSDLYLFADGPRGPKNLPAVRAVRALLHRERRFRHVVISEQERYRGPSQLVIAGLDELFPSFESLIVLQDDLVAAPRFLEFMNDGLRRYAKDARVGAVLGFDFGSGNGSAEPFFSRFFAPWGWATWRRAWAEFEPDPGPLLRRLENPALRRRFNLDGSCNFYRQLQGPDPGQAGSWHARWYASQFLRGHLALYPGTPLAQSLGLVLGGLRPAAPAQGPRAPFELQELAVTEDPAGTARIVRFFTQGHSSVQAPAEPPGFGAGLGRAWQRCRALFQ
jgi:hypothetical protein